LHENVVLRNSTENPHEIVDNVISDIFFKSYSFLLYTSVGKELRHITREEDSIFFGWSWFFEEFRKKNPHEIVENVLAALFLFGLKEFRVWLRI
jgi:hypothetical protein